MRSNSELEKNIARGRERVRAGAPRLVHDVGDLVREAGREARLRLALPADLRRQAALVLPRLVGEALEVAHLCFF